MFDMLKNVVFTADTQEAFMVNIQKDADLNSTSISTYIIEKKSRWLNNE